MKLAWDVDGREIWVENGEEVEPTPVGVWRLEDVIAEMRQRKADEEAEAEHIRQLDAELKKMLQ